MHRAAALILLYSFTLLTFELGVADVCGGDTTAAEVASSNVASVGALVDGSESNRAPVSTPSHLGLHVCHCVHAHGGVTSGSVVAQPAPPTSRFATVVDYLAPPAISFPPQLRPPIS